jgi:PII-like signaling protein
MTQQLFEVRKVLINSFRRIERYPIDERKVERLVESYRQTGYWGNLVGRVIGKDSIELAYGAHRRIAMDRYHKPTDKVPVIVQALDDEMMIRMMANENMIEFSSSALVDLETIWSTVTAFADGKIQLPKVKTSTQVRYAPSFIPGKILRAEQDFSYNAQTLGEFLGWLKTDGTPRGKVFAALNALEYIEEGYLKEEDFADITSTAVGKMVSLGEQRKRQHEAEAQAQRKCAEEEEERAAAAKDETERKKRQAAAEHHRKAAEEALKEGKRKAAKVIKGLADDRRDESKEKLNMRLKAQEIEPVNEKRHFQEIFKRKNIMAVTDEVIRELWQILNDQGKPLPDTLALKIQAIAKEADAFSDDGQLKRLVKALEGLHSRAGELTEKVNRAIETRTKQAKAARLELTNGKNR